MGRELISNYFLSKDKNCAETVFLSANETFGLGASEDAIKAVGVFGGGVSGCERLCGAAAGALCAIALKHSTGHAHQAPEMRERSNGFLTAFTDFYGSDLCKVIKPLHRKDDVRCLSVVEKAFEILENYI